MYGLKEYLCLFLIVSLKCNLVKTDQSPHNAAPGDSFFAKENNNENCKATNSCEKVSIFK